MTAAADPDWSSLKAPTLGEMETMAHAEFERLPKTFRRLCEGLVIRVDDFATDEVLDSMGIQREFDLGPVSGGRPAI